MSFARKVKEEIKEQIDKKRHCQIAELAAYFAFIGSVVITEEGGYEIHFHTENLTVLQKSYILFRKAFRTTPDISVRGEHQYSLYILDEDIAQQFIEAVWLQSGSVLVADPVVERVCCRRAFLRGTFLTGGSVTDPNSGYHLEMMAGSREKAESLCRLIQSFQVEAKIVERKTNYIVYMKEGAAIVDFLNIIGAHKALMEFENVRILKEMRNSINRKVNCEAANIKKTVSAASRQVEDIQYIRDTIGFESLSENLAEMAKVRLAHPDVPLKELGGLLETPLGKSGVNHRLRKLSEIAQNQREKDAQLEEENDKKKY